MTISPNLLLRIQQEATAFTTERATNENTAEQALRDAVEQVTLKIPRLIAEAFTSGASYVDVMTLIEGRDYVCPAWKDRLFSKGPSATWLTPCAAAVFAWCEASGLQPFLTPYRGLDRRESRIAVQWQPERLTAVLAANGGPAFIEQLNEKTLLAQAQKAAERAREDVKLVRRLIKEMHSNIDYASKQGDTKVKVTTSYSRFPDTDVRARGWTKQLIDYCEGLGLRVDLHTELEDDCRMPEAMYATTISVRWEPGTRIQRPAV